jgi:hypothetical protein
MSFRANSRVAFVIYGLLWLPALLVAAFVSFIGYLGTGFSPLWSALTFVLALPALLVGLWSFRASAVAIIGLLAWDIVSTTWPHVSLTGFLGSTIDVMLLGSAVLGLLVAVLSPFNSIIAFVRHERNE